MLPYLRITLGVACLSFLSTGVFADPPADEDTSLKNSLAVQQAMAQAQHYLYTANAARAVEVLEEQLSRINGNNTYLRILRKAYRSHIQDLWQANNGKQAKRYLERLCVLDPTAAQDPVLCGLSQKDRAGQGIAAPHSPETKPAPLAMTAQPPTTTALPSNPVPSYPAKQEFAATVVPAQPGLMPKWPGEPGSIMRGKIDDPFNMTNQRLGVQERSLARQLQMQGEAEYARQQFEEARKCFQRAYQADPQVLNAASREHWAYCILVYAGTQMKKAGITADRIEELRRLVQSAVTMAPSVGEASVNVMRELDSRRAQLTNTGADAIAVQHKSKNAQGWQLAETAHFRVLHREQSQDFVEKVIRTAERTRRDMFRKWFGHDGIRWDSKCDLVLHGTAAEYSKSTGAPLDSPGHASIEWAENKTGVVSRRIDIHPEQNGLLETLLPRETTHVVLAGMFGAVPMPRWADVGMAVLTESVGRVGEHRRNLANCHKDGSLIGVRELLQLPDYPEKQRIRAFYAQSVVLVEFLASQRGTAVFTEFLKDAAREGHELALRRHYGWNFSDLETHWGQYVVNESARLARAN